MNWKQGASVLVLLAAIGAGVWFHSGTSVDLDPKVLRERIEALGWWAPIGFMAAAGLRPFLLLPSFVVMSAGGLLFGMFQGILLSTIGFSLGAILDFVLARGLGREAVQKRMRPGRLAALDAFLSGRGAPWLGFYTALPVTVLTPVFAAAGLSGMSVGPFALWVTLGLLPRTALYSYFGDSWTKGSTDIIVSTLVLASACVAGVVVASRLLRGRRGDSSGGN